MGSRPDIRFCTTPDGVRLAMAFYGSGPPLVKAATWLTHVELDAQSDTVSQWNEELNRRNRLVTYDTRGCGLSDRNVDDISLDAWVRDLEAVVDACGLERFPLFGISCGAATAVAYAARHPERVSRLILVGSYATSYFTTQNTDPRLREEAETLLTLARLGWGTGGTAFRQVFVCKFMPGADAGQQQRFDAYQRETATPEMAEKSLRAMYAINIKEAARQVRCPTLVIHSRDDQLVPYDQGRKVAALIPGARLVPIDSVNHVPFANEPGWPVIVKEMHAFLDEEHPVPPRSVRLTPRQQEVLRHVAHGKTDKEIARELQLSPRTVEMHVAGALQALGCSSRAKAVHSAMAAGLLAD